jgi:hypothetical protein
VKRDALFVRGGKRQAAWAHALAMVVLLIASTSPAWAQPPLAPPQDIQGFDTPNDGGASLTVV